MKSKIRSEYKLLRSEMTKEDVDKKSDIAQNNFLNTDIYKNSKCIMLYMPLGNETATQKIIDKAFSDGKCVAFPVTDEKSGIITAYLAEKDTKFKKGGFSVFEPELKQTANVLDIDTVLVPGIAYDRKGARVGFGKGCYDRFLEGLNVVKVGFCYEAQLCNDIETDEYDILMDYIITEKEIIKAE